MRSALILLTVFLLTSFGNPGVPDQIMSVIEGDIEYLLEFYRHRHQHPEISLEEKQTSRDLAAELRKIGFDVTEGIGGYGVVGILENGEGPLILYRTDMDALPMYEKTGLDYASAVEIDYKGIKTGAMHSCGHDVHMTTWVGTARAMVELRDKWSGTLMLIGQPAEEIGMGARMMLEAGLYQTFGVPDYGLGLHSSPTIRAGKIGLDEGYSMAAVESVDITVYGIGAHGASPHMSVDPVVIASMMVMDLQTIVSRSLDPLERAVVTVGAIQGGTVHNIIPDEVTLKLTIRTFKPEVRELVRKRIREIAEGVAIAAGLPTDKMPEVKYRDSFTPANYNNPGMVESIRSSAAKVIGNENIEVAEPQMVGEDFSNYGATEHNVPTTLFWLGTVTAEKIEAGDLPGLHSPYYFPEPKQTLETGVAVTTQSLIDLFNS